MIKARKKKLSPSELLGKIFIYIALILFALWVLLPFSIVFLTSFKDIREANSLDFHWLPEKFTILG